MRMGRVSGIPRKHAHSLQRRPSLAFSFGTCYRSSRRPLYPAKRDRGSPSRPRYGLVLEILLAQKTKLPCFTTVCSGKSDTLP